MNRWKYLAVWAPRDETPLGVASRLNAFIETLASEPFGLDAWFIEGEYRGRLVLWDARGSSPLIERRLAENLQEIDLQQGLPTIRTNSVSLTDGHASRASTCLLVNIANAVPVPAWMPCRLELEFLASSKEMLLRPESTVSIIRRIVEAFQPWWVLFDSEGRRDFSSDDLFFGRPLVGRATYLASAYGRPRPSASLQVVDVGSGSVVIVRADDSLGSSFQDVATSEVRAQLANDGHLLTWREYLARASPARS